MTPDEALTSIFGNFRIECHNHLNGWIANFFDESGAIWGTGIRSIQAEAINVCISEAVERRTFENVSINQKYLTNEMPSTCGFAAGVNEQKTHLRSWLEAFERWCFSKWIDEKYSIDRFISPQLTPLAQTLQNDFDEVLRFKIDFIATEHEIPFDLQLGITIGVKDEGVFVGSRVAHLDDDIWEHGLAEAWVNLLNVKTQTRYLNQEPLDIIDQRVLFFSKNAHEAFSQIPVTGSRNNWPSSKLRLKVKINEVPAPFFVFRTVFADFTSWEKGPVNRFVY